MSKLHTLLPKDDCWVPLLSDPPGPRLPSLTPPDLPSRLAWRCEDVPLRGDTDDCRGGSECTERRSFESWLVTPRCDCDRPPPSRCSPASARSGLEEAALASAVPARMYGGWALSACIGLPSAARASCLGGHYIILYFILLFIYVVWYRCHETACVDTWRHNASHEASEALLLLVVVVVHALTRGTRTHDTLLAYC